MSAERKKILEMVSEGKISAEDAERLLDKIGKPVVEGATTQDVLLAGETTGTAAASGKKYRYLRILVERPGEDNVNVRVPLAFTRTGARLLAVMPRRVTERLSEQGIDLEALGALKGEELGQALEHLNVDIEKGDGKKVKIFCE